MPEGDVLVLIPARMASNRLPGKALADIAGKPMIVHMLALAKSAAVGPVAVATDSREVVSVVEAAGGQAVMTRADLASGSDRIHEAMGLVDPAGRANIVVNLQGDMPTLAPAEDSARRRDPPAEALRARLPEWRMSWNRSWPRTAHPSRPSTWRSGSAPSVAWRRAVSR